MTTSRNGFSGSVTKACKMCVVIGRGTPAISPTSVDQPAVDVSARREHARDAAVRLLDGEDLRVGVDLDAATVGAAREPPDDRVMADDPAGAVVERADDRRVSAGGA